MDALARPSALAALAAAAALVLPACSAHMPSGTSAPATRTLAIGEGMVLGDDFQLQFVDVPGDSRCPTGVTCVWEGEARVVVGPSHPLMRMRPDTLLVRGTRPDSLVVGPFVVKVTRLAPYPAASSPIPREAYRATFVVRRAG